jgi:hypothetical protein
MTALNDYLTAGLKAFEAWRPRLEERLARRNYTFPGTGSDVAPSDSPDEIPSESIFPVVAGNDPVNLPITLDQLLAQCGKLPSHSVALGVCDDGLPFLLDLTNPAPGALLICSDSGAGKSSLLLSILDSAVRMNPPEQLELSVIADHIDDYMNLAKVEHCQEIFSSDEDVTGELIGELAEIAEERRRNRPEDPAILLVIDDLAECLEHLDQRAFDRLYWLIRHGPRSRVWTIATLPMERARAIEARFLSAFRTRLFGKTNDRKLTALLSDDDALQTGGLENSQFYIPYGGEWLRLWACKPEIEKTISEGGVE